HLALEDGFGLMDEMRTVAGFTRRSRRQDIDRRGARLIGQRLEAMQRGKSPRYAFLIHLSGQRYASAEAAQHFLVEKNGRRPRMAFIDDETDRIRPDIDNGDRGDTRKTPLGF